MAYSTRPLRTQLVSVYYLLLLGVTMLSVIGMPDLVGADWPGWTSTVFVAYLVSLLLAALLVAASGWLAYAARWGIVVGVLIVIGKVVWGLYDAGERAVFLVLALSPVLLLGALAILLLWFVWPRGRLPDDVALPATPLPLPVRRPWVVRNVVRGNGCVGFEMRWLEFPRLKRLAVYLGPPLPVGLPALQVRPAGASSVVLEAVADDVDLESEEFNRAYEVRGADRRYVVDMLHPRTMQALLDAKPMGLVVERDAIVGYADGGPSRLEALARVVAGIPGHVFDRWGVRVGPAMPRLAFTGRTWSRTVFGGMLLSLGAAAGLLSVTLACCLAAVAAEHNSRDEAFTPPNYSVGTLVLAAAVLAVLAVCCTALDRTIGRITVRTGR